MKLISHRGNICGRESKNENKPDYITNAIDKGFDCEVDIWHQDGLYLGHDNPAYEIDLDFLLRYHDQLWIHCKDLESLESLSQNEHLNVFWHESDDYTLTSKGFIWTYPHKKICSKSVIVSNSAKYSKFQNCYGVCSDNLL